MKKLKVTSFTIGLLALCYFGAMAFRSLSVEDAVTELRTDHFIITYCGIPSVEAHNLADQLEGNYIRIRTALKDPEHDRIRVFVHSTQADFNKSTGLIHNTANGTSRGPNQFHLLWTTWYNSILPDDPIKTAIHEFTHCVQLNILIKDAQSRLSVEDSVGFDKAFEHKFANDYPQWFWEALCDYEAGIVNKVSVKYGMRKNHQLNDLNSSHQIYQVGYTLIEYIVEKWGADKLPALITSYVDIETVLKVSESDFEKGWIDFVNEKY